MINHVNFVNRSMLNLPQIAYKSITSASRSPGWWILSLLQIIALTFIAPSLAQPRLLLHLVFILWLVAGVIIFTVSTVWLWLDIDERRPRNGAQKSVKPYITMCLTTGSILLCALALIIITRLGFVAWVFFALITSIVAATAVLAMLFAVLINQNLGPSLALALDTWNKKTSLATAVALTLIMGHAVSFTLMHTVVNPASFSNFSDIHEFATIWVMLGVLLLIVIVSFFVAILNCFLVLLFIEIIRQKKDPEAVAEALAHKTVLQATQ